MLMETGSKGERRGWTSEGSGRNKTRFLLKNHHMTTCLAEILEPFGTYFSFSQRKQGTRHHNPRDSTEVL